MKIKVGGKVCPKYRGKVAAEYEVKAIAKLEQPMQYMSAIKGRELFNRTIVLLEALDDAYPALGKGHKELWFPYWIATSATKMTERYRQFAPMFTEDVFLQLLTEAIKQGFFSTDFVRNLNCELQAGLNNIDTM